jgi:hypothetical protein
MARPLFLLGQVVVTPGRLRAFEATGQVPSHFLERHNAGDWGELSTEDIAENVLSLAEGFRLLSAYRLADQTRIWIITEADRSSTCLLLPEEY